MKSTIWMAMLVIVMVAGTSATAQMPPNQDQTPGFFKAMMIADTEIVRYSGQFGHDRVYPNGRVDRVRGEFILNPNGQIVRLAIDGVTLHSDPRNPLPGFPRNMVGQVHNFWIWVEGFEDTKSRSSLRGYFADAFLKADENIFIEMRIVGKTQTVPFEVPNDVDPENLTVRDAEGRGIGYYDQSSDRIRIFVNPDSGPIQYNVVDSSTGEVLDSGWVNPISTPQRMEGHALSFHYEEGIELIDLRGGRSGAYFPNQTFESEFHQHGPWIVPAKYAVIKRSEASEDTYVYLRGFDGRDGSVVAFTPEGYEYPVRPVSAGGGLEKVFRIPSGQETVVLVILENGDRDGLFDLRIEDGGAKG